MSSPPKAPYVYFRGTKIIQKAFGNSMSHKPKEQNRFHSGVEYRITDCLLSETD